MAISRLPARVNDPAVTAPAWVTEKLVELMMLSQPVPTFSALEVMEAPGSVRLPMRRPLTVSVPAAFTVVMAATLITL